MRYILLPILSLFVIVLSAQTPNNDNNSGVPAPKQTEANQAASNQNMPVSVAAAVITMDTQQGQLSVMIPQVTLKEIEKDWQRYAANGSKGKTSAADGQFTQYDAVNKNISADPFNITAKMLATTEGVKVTVWLSDNNNFQNAKASSGDRSLALQKYLRDFAVAEYKQSVRNELKAGQEKQKDLENDLTKMVKEEERINKNTEDHKRSIQKANDAIATHKNDIVSATAKIEAQKGVVSSVAADPNASKGAKKTQHDLEDDKVKLQKQNDRESKNIESWGNDIKANERSVSDIQGKKALKRDEIERQKLAVQAIQVKLDGIK